MKPLNGDKFTIGVLIAVLAILLLLWVFKAKAAPAAPICGKTADLEATLALRGEAEAAKGATIQGRLMRLFQTPTGDTWSLVLTLGDGRSCLVDAGANWEATVRREGSL